MVSYYELDCLRRYNEIWVAGRQHGGEGGEEYG